MTTTFNNFNNLNIFTTKKCQTNLLMKLSK